MKIGVIGAGRIGGGIARQLSAAGHDSYGAWREKAHDDLVLAVAMAVWVGEHAAGRVMCW